MRWRRARVRQIEEKLASRQRLQPRRARAQAGARAAAGRRAQRRRRGGSQPPALPLGGCDGRRGAAGAARARRPPKPGQSPRALRARALAGQVGQAAHEHPGRGRGRGRGDLAGELQGRRRRLLARRRRRDGGGGAGAAQGRALPPRPRHRRHQRSVPDDGRPLEARALAAYEQAAARVAAVARRPGDRAPALLDAVAAAAWAGEPAHLRDRRADGDDAAARGGGSRAAAAHRAAARALGSPPAPTSTTVRTSACRDCSSRW